MGSKEDVPFVIGQCDLNRMDTEGWPHRPYPPTASRPHGVPIVIRQSVFNAIHNHGRSTIDVEVCGVLVGNGYRDETGPYVYIEHSIRGEHAGNHLAQVTFTAETWNHIQQELDHDFPQLRIMGWYHTHPGFGVFLSSMDLFIHRHFFNASEQLALVYDPVRRQEGVFVWRDGVPTLEAVVVESDEDDVEATTRLETGSIPELTAAAITGSPIQTVDLSELRRRQQLHSLVIGLLAAVTIIWPIGLQVLCARWREVAVVPTSPREPIPPMRPVTPHKIPPPGTSSPGDSRESSASPDLPAIRQSADSSPSVEKAQKTDAESAPLDQEK